MDRIIQHVRIKVRTVPIEKDRILANPPSNGRIIIPCAKPQERSIKRIRDKTKLKPQCVKKSGRSLVGSDFFRT